jgi:hypothetical protein
MNRRKIGYSLLIIGVIGLSIALMGFENIISDFYVVWLGLLIGWILIILGASLISHRVAAITILIVGFYFCFLGLRMYPYGGDWIGGFYIACFAFSASILHIIVGCTLGIIYLVHHKKSQIQNN